MRLRSRLNPEEQINPVEGPTSFKRGPNRWQLVCAICGEIYYVDNITFRQAMLAMEEGGENTFCCDQCEADLEDLAH